MGRLLGLDWGAKRIGVAVSDDRRVLAVGYGIWPAAEPAFSRMLARTVSEEDIEAIIVGYPLTLRGEVGPTARAVDRFIADLEARGYHVFRCDERNTTFSAARSLSRAGISERRQRGRIDMSAAVLMLQSYLDAQTPRDPDSP
ncbi:Holliday junction resolvase RuvX [candidate division KSB1 bacterium]|nr:Holliday junction resolvase RuvX [candidate division KSB1 bacterium]